MVTSDTVMIGTRLYSLLVINAIVIRFVLDSATREACHRRIKSTVLNDVIHQL